MESPSQIPKFWFFALLLNICFVSLHYFYRQAGNEGIQTSQFSRSKPWGLCFPVKKADCAYCSLIHSHWGVFPYESLLGNLLERSSYLRKGILSVLLVFQIWR